MNTANFLSIFAKQKLNRQGGAVKPFTISYPWDNCLGFTALHKRLPFCYSDITVYLKDDYFEVFFSRSSMEKAAEYYIDKLRKDPQYVRRLHKHWKTHDVPKFLHIMRMLEKMDLRHETTPSLKKHFGIFTKAHNILWRESVFHDAFDATGDKLLHEAVQKASIDLSQEELQILTATATHTWMQKEKAALLALYGSLQRNTKLKLAVSRGASYTVLSKQFPAFARLLQQHVGKFHWMLNDYAVIRRLGPEYFLAQLRHWLQHPQTAVNEKKAINERRDVRLQRSRLARTKNIPSAVTRISNLLAELSTWRDERKAYNQMANAFLLRFARELSRRSGIPVATIEYCYYWELPLLLIKPREIAQQAEHRRRQGILSVRTPRIESNNVYGAQAQRARTMLNNAVQQQNGLTGKPSYPGIVRGKVRIILIQKEFNKMQRGDVLVAPNTRPEYVPVMKIAGAIITEEGGVTSHAAIVSRELKVPCIVGVQSATQTLHDGDLVEVDAEKGIVRKLRE